jgi:hypothetical protein
MSRRRLLWRAADHVLRCKYTVSRWRAYRAWGSLADSSIRSTDLWHGSWAQQNSSLPALRTLQPIINPVDNTTLTSTICNSAALPAYSDNGSCQDVYLSDECELVCVDLGGRGSPCKRMIRPTAREDPGDTNRSAAPYPARVATTCNGPATSESKARSQQQTAPAPPYAPPATSPPKRVSTSITAQRSEPRTQISSAEVYSSCLS